MGALGRRKLVTGILFLAPALFFIIVFFLYPTFMSFHYSLTDWNGIKETYNFVGLKNYIKVLTANNFLQILKNTVFFAIIYVPVLNVVALTLAVLISNCGKTQNLYKSIVFFPNVLALAVIGYVWKMLYDTNTGAFNMFLRWIGLDNLARDWLGLNSTVLPAISLTVIWFAAGYYMVIYLAGIMAIPTDMYEAASIDGGNPWQKFWYITFPMLAPSMTINVVLSTIGILSFFDLPYTMTMGGPGSASTTLALQIYLYNFKYMQPANGVALSVILCVLNVAVAVVQLKLLRKREVGA